MERERVTSSNIHSAGYDGVAGTLEVKFHESGVYQYFNVPRGIYERLMAAPSKGKFFDEHIKERFRYKKVFHA